MIYEHTDDDRQATFHFDVKYQYHTAIRPSLEDPGEPEHCEILSVNCLRVESSFCEYATPNETVAFCERVPSDSELPVINDWFQRIINADDGERMAVEEKCLSHHMSLTEEGVCGV